MTCQLAQRLRRNFAFWLRAGNIRMVERAIRIAREKVRCPECLDVVKSFAEKLVARRAKERYGL